ncbi:MAG TPA: beta-xylosidase [Opitutaceae bacterium]|nr:beta-xylosidase [Opitutaceae bacterium]
MLIFGLSRPAALCRASVFAMLAAVALAAPAFAENLTNAAPAFPVTIKVDAAKDQGTLRPIWRFFGCDEPNYATMKDGRKLLGELGELKPDAIYFRSHNLLNTGDGTAAFKWGSTNIYTEDAQGNPVYNWMIVDNLIDTYRARRVRPYLQLGFMPQALSIHPDPYQHVWRPGFKYDLISTGWAYPPKDYKKWAELIYQWTKHCVERYGREEVESWYFEVWNEPNGPAYWHGTPEEFYKLHDYAVDAVRRALPTARVGGPDVAGDGGAFMDGFLKHIANGTNYVTGKTGTPTDFVSFHAKGSPKFIDGHVRMGLSTHLNGVDRGFARIAAVPELKNKPIVIGESDPEGCAACQGPQNGYRNGTMYSSYTAASFPRKLALAERHAVNFEGALTWAFEFEDQPYFAGFRALGSNGLDLPVLNVFRMFSMMSGNHVAATSSAEVPLDAIMKAGVREQPDVAAFASFDGGKLSVMIWHYHDDDVPGPDAEVTFTAEGLRNFSGEATLTHYRIDGSHSNSYAAWKQMGSPLAPNENQYAELEKAGKLAQLEPSKPVQVSHGSATLKFSLPRQGVSFLVLELPSTLR